MPGILPAKKGLRSSESSPFLSRNFLNKLERLFSRYTRPCRFPHLWKSDPISWRTAPRSKFQFDNLFCLSSGLQLGYLSFWHVVGSPTQRLVLLGIHSTLYLSYRLASYICMFAYFRCEVLCHTDRYFTAVNIYYTCSDKFCITTNFIVCIWHVPCIPFVFTLAFAVPIRRYLLMFLKQSLLKHRS